MIAPQNQMPGFSVTQETVERALLASTTWPTYRSVTLDSAAVDATNTPTTTLRKGLVLGRITASGKYKEYDAGAGDGSEVARCLLGLDVNMLDPISLVPTDKMGAALCVGHVHVADTIGLDAGAKADLLGRISFDEDT